MSERSGPLSNLRVLDLSRVFAGPFVAQLFGDLGADVVKVERPRTGDDFRHVGVFLKDKDGKPTRESHYYLSANRNKKSITVNLASKEGQDIVRRLAAQSDVLVENYKTGDLAGYGLDYESLKSVNPRLVYCSMTGFGQTGPYRERPGYDSLFQAMSGIMNMTGHPDGEPGAGPMKTGVIVGDFAGAFHAAFGILAAIYHRDRVSGRGQYLDMSILDANIAMLSHGAMSYFLTGENPARVGNGSPGAAPVGRHRCKDGDLMITASQHEQWRRFCTTMGHPEWFDDPRFADITARWKNRVELTAAIESVTMTMTKQEVQDMLSAVAISTAPINTVPEVFADPQVRHREMEVEVPHPLSGTLKLVASPIRLSETPVAGYTAPPLLGANTDEILRERLGLSGAEVAALRDAKAI